MPSVCLWLGWGGSLGTVACNVRALQVSVLDFPSSGSVLGHWGYNIRWTLISGVRDQSTLVVSIHIMLGCYPCPHWPIHIGPH